MADLPMFIVDAFTCEPFAGNPAAVCLLHHVQTMNDGLLQKIASEMNLSETAYVQCLSESGSFEKDDTFSLRWFTPTREVPLCGHATLASAATLFFCAGNTNSMLTFHSLSGPLLARRTGDTGITLDFPLNPVQQHDKDTVKPVLQEICGHEHVSDVQYSRTTKKLLVRLKDELTRDFLEGLAPDPRALQASDTSGDVTGVIVTLKGSPDEHGYDFLSRYFAPWNGIPEDPVTGSAHTVLADYWSKQLGKTTFKDDTVSLRWFTPTTEVSLCGHATLASAATLFFCAGAVYTVSFCTRHCQSALVHADHRGVAMWTRHPGVRCHAFLLRSSGSAHTVLADYWSKQLGKTTFNARQCSRRGGDLEVNIAGNRVELTGSARVVLKGALSSVDLDC